MGAQRADIEDMMKRAKDSDNIISKVMASTDSYDRLFETELVGTTPLHYLMLMLTSVHPAQGSPGIKCSNGPSTLLPNLVF